MKRRRRAKESATFDKQTHKVRQDDVPRLPDETLADPGCRWRCVARETRTLRNLSRDTAPLHTVNAVGRVSEVSENRRHTR